MAAFHRTGADGWPQYGNTYSVYRQGTKVVAIGFEVHAQDDVFWPVTADNPEGGMSRSFAQFVAMATGMTPTVNSLVQLGHRCDQGKAQLVLKRNTQRYVVSCSTSTETVGAVTVRLQVFLETP